MMLSIDIFLLSVGGLLLIGLLTSTVSERTFLPRVTMLILLGIAIGEYGVNVLPAFFSQHFDVIADLTLMMVGFLLGSKLCKATFQTSAKAIIVISLMTAIVTAFVVTLGLLFFKVDLALAVLLGTIASATAPAAIVDVVKESKLETKFTDALLSIVALDDVWALLLFAVAMAFVSNLGATPSDYSFVLRSLFEIVGAVGVGALLGVPAAYLTGRIRDGQPMMLEAVGIVAVCGGLAMWLDVSYLIACIVLGAVVVNLAKHHQSPFHSIENIESLFLIIFFVAAGASLELKALQEIGYLGIAYIVLRCSGKYVGAWLGIASSEPADPAMRWMRFALLPQAGVSIGMALVASARFPQHQQTIMSLVIASTVFFEIVGPIYTRIAITKANQAEGVEK